MIDKKAEIDSRILLYNACKGILRTKLAAGPSPVPPGMDDLYAEMGVNPNADPSAAANRMSQQQAMQAPNGYAGAWPPPQGPKPGTQQPANSTPRYQAPAYTGPQYNYGPAGGVSDGQMRSMANAMNAADRRTRDMVNRDVQDRNTSILKPGTYGRMHYDDTVAAAKDAYDNSVFYDFNRLNNDPHAYDEVWNRDSMAVGKNNRTAQLKDIFSIRPKTKGRGFMPSIGLNALGVINYLGAPAVNYMQARNYSILKEQENANNQALAQQKQRLDSIVAQNKADRARYEEDMYRQQTPEQQNQQYYAGESWNNAVPDNTFAQQSSGQYRF